MDEKHQIWQTWARSLNRWGAQGAVATILEAGGPFNFLAAQFVYLAQPLVDAFITPRHLDELANMLENEAETRSFVTFLREGVSS